MLVDGPISIILGVLVLLLSGVFVSSFIGNKLIISGINGEKKLAEKTEEEIRNEEGEINKIKETLERVEEKLESLDKKIN